MSIGRDKAPALKHSDAKNQIPPTPGLSSFVTHTQIVGVQSCDLMGNGKILIRSNERKDNNNILRIYDPQAHAVLVEKIIPDTAKYVGILGSAALPNNHIACYTGDATWLLDSATLKGVRKIKNMELYHSWALFGNYLIHPNQHYDILFFCDLRNYKTRKIAVPELAKGWVDSIVPLSATQLAITVSNRIMLFNFDELRSRLVCFKQVEGFALESTDSNSTLRLIPLPNERFMTIESANKGTLKVWDMSSLQCLRQTFGSDPMRPFAKDPQLLPDGKTLIGLGRKDNQICLWDTDTLTSCLIDCGREKITDYTILQNGEVLLAATDKLLTLDLPAVRELRNSKIDLALAATPIITDIRRIIYQYVNNDVSFTANAIVSRNPFQFFERLTIGKEAQIDAVSAAHPSSKRGRS